MTADTTKIETPSGVVLGPPQKPTDLGTLGPYRVIRVIGRGGMGVVFLGVDPKLRRKVALKVMLPKFLARPQARERFLREARALAAVENDHVVPIYQVDEDGGTPYIALKYLQGSTLEDYLRSGAKLSVAQMLHLAREIATGLAAAHDHHVIHRDIKPDNIWLEAPEGRVRLIDFGLARQPAQNANTTADGTILGTPAYMSPEQARGAEVDARSDLFSLGGVIYRLFAGGVPFKGDTPLNTVLTLTNEPHLPLTVAAPQVPEALSRLVDALLAKDPAQRPASAREVVKELKRIEAKPRGAEQPAFAAIAIPEASNTWAALETDEHGSTSERMVRATLPRERPVWPWVAGAVTLAAVAVIVVLASAGGKPPGSAAEAPKKAAPPKSPPTPKPLIDPVPALFNGRDLSGWVAAERWKVADGVLTADVENGAGEHLITDATYGSFELRLEYRFTGNGGDSGVVLFAADGHPGVEVQIGEPLNPFRLGGNAKQRHGAFFGMQQPFKNAAKGTGEWNAFKITVKSHRVSVEENGQLVNEFEFTPMAERRTFRERHLGLFEGKAPIALQCKAGSIEFRNLRVKE